MPTNPLPTTTSRTGARRDDHRTTHRRAPGAGAPAATSRSRRRRIGATTAAMAVALGAVLLGGPAPAGADAPYLPQPVGFSHVVDGCDLHLAASSEIADGAEVRTRITTDDPVVYEDTFVIEPGGSGLFAESLEWGDEVMPGIGGGNLLVLELTYGDLVIDDYASSVSFPDCDDLAPLTVTVDATGAVPSGQDLQVEVRTGECGNDQTPSAVASGQPGSSFTVWAAPGATCPSPVDTLGATVSYDPVQQTQVEDVVGAAVGVTFDFAQAPDPADPADPIDPPVDPEETTTTTDPEPMPTPTSTSTAPVDPSPGDAEVLGVEVLPAAAATPVAVWPSFTG